MIRTSYAEALYLLSSLTSRFNIERVNTVILKISNILKEKFNTFREQQRRIDVSSELIEEDT